MRSAIASVLLVLLGCGRAPEQTKTSSSAPTPAGAASAEPNTRQPPPAPPVPGRQAAIDIVGITTLYQEGNVITAIVPNSSHAGHRAMLLIPQRFLVGNVEGSKLCTHQGEDCFLIPLDGEEILLDLPAPAEGEPPQLEFSLAGSGTCPTEESMTSLRWVPLLSDVAKKPVVPKPEFISPDPDAARVSARMTMRSGKLESIIGEPNVWTFKAKGEAAPADPHRQFMAAGVKYVFPYTGNELRLTLRKFRSNERRTIVLDAQGEPFLTLKLANLPEGAGAPGRTGDVDEHFALYYDMVAGDVPPLLPHLEKAACPIKGAIDGVNCGPDRLVSKNTP
jgi:hypothetical protein